MDKVLELSFVFITSATHLKPYAAKPAEAVDSGNGMAIRAYPSSYTKCERCWHYCEDVGSHTEHPHLCGRCIENIEGAGEQREYA
jgi:isoleucyl-tRNA synthetase